MYELEKHPKGTQYANLLSLKTANTPLQPDQQPAPMTPAIAPYSSRIQTVNILGTSEKLYIIDNFSDHPKELLKFAQNVAYLQPVGADGTLYPGKRDNMPKPYRDALADFITKNIEQKSINLPKGAVDVHRSMLSLTTQPPETLQLAQKIPHVDSTDDTEYATVHYLCSSKHGGTGIYRYKPNAKVQILKGEESIFSDMLKRVQLSSSEHKGYLAKNTSLFEQVAHVAAQFNRLVIYKSNLLHSALLTEAIDHQSNVQEGRLTIASFFSITPSTELDTRGTV